MNQCHLGTVAFSPVWGKEPQFKELRRSVVLSVQPARLSLQECSSETFQRTLAPGRGPFCIHALQSAGAECRQGMEQDLKPPATTSLWQWTVFSWAAKQEVRDAGGEECSGGSCSGLRLQGLKPASGGGKVTCWLPRGWHNVGAARVWGGKAASDSIPPESEGDVLPHSLPSSSAGMWAHSLSSQP